MANIFQCISRKENIGIWIGILPKFVIGGPIINKSAIERYRCQAITLTNDDYFEVLFGRTQVKLRDAKVFWWLFLEMTW